MISASAADAHKFGRVRRNGYDPAEVDAVVSRLVDTLRTYENTTTELQDRLAEADASADAIRRTFVAAEKTRDEILDSARAQARTMTDGARDEADQILDTARAAAAESTERARREVMELSSLSERLGADMAATRARILADAEAEAQRTIEEAEAEAARRTTAAAHRALEGTRATAAEAADHRRRAKLAARAAATAAARMRREATQDANRKVTEAEEHAASILAEAERDRTMLADRARHLRSAIETLEASAARLAALAGSQAELIDLNEIEALERAELDLPDVDLRAIERAEAHLRELDDQPSAATDVNEDPATASDHITSHDIDGHRDESEPNTEHAEAIATDTSEDHDDIDDAAGSPPAVDGGPLPEPRRLLTVAEASHEIAREDEADLDVTPDHAPSKRSDTTYYQKSSGFPLSQRVKLARRSG